MGLDEVADDLYGLPMEQFTEVRNVLAKELSASGDKETAAAVRKLLQAFSGSVAGEPARSTAPKGDRGYPKEIEMIASPLEGTSINQTSLPSDGDGDSTNVEAKRAGRASRVVRISVLPESRSR
jgi:hypothetical protein